MPVKCDIGVIGLSVMGRGLARNIADHGFQVAGFNRNGEVTKAVMQEEPNANLHPVFSLQELMETLSKPRRILLMIKAGEPVDQMLDQLIPLLEPGDIVMDGGNSFFADTRRRTKRLAEHGLHFFGVGVSGGETGARFGPAIMPGGARDHYALIGPILESIAARAEDGMPCCTYIGPDGAGHFVKMVHNGIEYADMQLIAESYLVLKSVGGFSNHELADIFAQWNTGELRSYLIGITAEVLREPDDLSAGDLVDHIEDAAGQKGTGRWASIESLEQGVDLSMITGAVDARILSGHQDERRLADLGAPEAQQISDRHSFVETVRQGLYLGKIAAYAQGFALMHNASKQYGWNLNLGAIASIFRAGCIIQAAFLSDITAAFERNPELENLLLDPAFAARVRAGHMALRQTVANGVLSGVPMPVMTSAVAYLDGYRGAPVGANLIQAQRDYFGAHTYRRTDRDGVFHHEWGQHNGR